MIARTAALCQLRALLVTTPEPLRSELRPLPAPDCSPASGHTSRSSGDPELRGAQLASKRWRGASSSSPPRSANSPARSSSSRAASPAAPRPAGHRAAARGAGRARLVAPRTHRQRSRLRPPRRRRPDPCLLRPNRSGTGSTEAATASSTAPSTRSSSPGAARTRPTIDYINRRMQEGKSRRDATRCLKRYLARNLYRLLENPPLPT